MIDPFAGVRTLDGVAMTTQEELTAGLCEPFDEVPDFDPAEAPEVDPGAGLDETHLHMRMPTKRLFVDYRPNPEALKTLAKLPRERQSLHGVLHAKHSAWDLVPAIISRTGRNIAELHIATLSYSAQTSAELLGLLDEGKIRRCSLVVSYYFKAQNPKLYDTLVPPLRERGHRVLAMRNHAKILLIKVAGGGSYVLEGSANLRSCKNVEQIVLTRDRRLYLFHRQWLEDELLSRSAANGQSHDES